MAKSYKTPGVYVEEIVKVPPSVTQVETAIPAFIGYTEKATNKTNGDLKGIPTRITSLLEYETFFGIAKPETTIRVTINETMVGGTTARSILVNPPSPKEPFLMYYSLQMYFTNGGGPCYIVSVGRYGTGLDAVDTQVSSINNSTALKTGLDLVEKVDEVTLIIFPDATALSTIEEFARLYNDALAQCNKLQDRFTIIDTRGYDAGIPTDSNITDIRNNISSNKDELKYGAVYYPFLITNLDYQFDESYMSITHTQDLQIVTDSAQAADTKGPLDGLKLDAIEGIDNAMYHKILTEIRNLPVELPPSSTMAGIYAKVDSSRGVWKAPANVSLSSVIMPSLKVDNHDQEDLNEDTVAGKSINAIRAFAGKGVLVWGARTLAGNDNEWRYISVRRFFNMIEESIKKATEPFVFEPNDNHTWVRVKAMIENFLFSQWRAGALAGAKPDNAFYVKVGLGATMTAKDILEGNMIVEIGMAVVKPAEFIILRIFHKMQK